ncbi:PEPxxWA-CTERM sorting domain-containing protein [uncultured Sphingomonas sp.]|uniref:PEPxxWA-CTERM sorting domain-containing protein n=1 Tax=uncultured Sphingomonas sp. TaxID=158754 RepID=UPI0035CC75D8
MTRISKYLAKGIAGLCLFGASPLAAQMFELRYSGWLSADETLIGSSGIDLIEADTRFDFTARFDTAGPNLVAALPFPGFVAYAPTSATISILGQNYRVIGATEDPAYGIGIALFDRSNVFFPGIYGVGFIANPSQDGAGIIGDFASASPGFSVANPTSTVFSDFAGAGYLAGIGCAPPDPRPCTASPIALIGSGGASFGLGLVTGERVGGLSHSASLTAVPEPGTWALLMLGFGAVGAVLRRQRRPRAGLAGRLRT